MSYTFGYLVGLESLDLSNLKTDNVFSMSNMFLRSTKLSYLNIKNFNTKKVKDFSSMFGYCTNIREIDLSNFDPSNS